MQPTFEYIPVLGTIAGTTLRIASISGISTIHGDQFTDRGRLYGTLTFTFPTYTVNLYSDVSRDDGSLVLSGTTTALQSYFEMSAQNGSQLSGRAWIDAYLSDDLQIVALPTFAVDVDVLKVAGQCQLFGSYDARYGLGYFHADAMRKIMTSDLPAAVPHLFGMTGLAAFVPQTSVAMPDLRTIANADQLREAQAALVKALAAEDSEQAPAMQEISRMARQRYAEAMANLKAANVQETVAAAQEKATDLGFSFGNFRRV